LPQQALRPARRQTIFVPKANSVTIILQGRKTRTCQQHAVTSRARPPHEVGTRPPGDRSRDL